MYSDYEKIVLGAIKYMEDNLEEQLTLDDIAQAIHFSKFHFMRIFESITGQSIGVYFFRRRMTNAARIIKEEESDMLSVSLRCGYNSQEAFTRAFREYFKVTPANYAAKGVDISNLFCYPLVQSDLLNMQEFVMPPYEVVQYDQCTLLGFEYWGNNQKKELSVIINDFVKQLRMQEESVISGIDSLIGYQSCDDEISMEISNVHDFYYLVGVKITPELQKAILNAKSITIPANKYAKFKLTSRIDLLQSDIRRAYYGLLREGIYQPADVYAFEKYDKSFIPNSPDSYMDFFIPIK